jgi:ketosteroid isomerase-like protein
MIDYAKAGEWLEAYGIAWQTFDGDAWVGLFTEDAEYHEDPFGTPLVGHNALRAYLLEAAASETDVEFTVERHWASGDTLLAAWHAGFVRKPGGQHARLAGFLTAEIASDGRASRFREWTLQAPGTAG